MPDAYPIGYSNEAVSRFEERSLEENAAFLLPHLAKDMRLLDCGCGPGSISLDFASYLSEGQVVGVDIESSQVGKARARAEEKGIQNATFLQGDIYALPFEEGSFDVVFTHAVIWALPDPMRALRELKRVLKPGGILACREPDLSKTNFSPKLPLLTEAISLQCEGLEMCGSDPYIGSKLEGYFERLHPESLDVICAKQTFVGKGKIESLMNYSSHAWDFAPWAVRLQESGRVSPEKVAEIKSATQEFKRHPDAYFEVTWVEALAFFNR